MLKEPVDDAGDVGGTLWDDTSRCGHCSKKL
jgi:hypothetical protein